MSDPSSSAPDPNALDPWTILDRLPDYLAVLDAGGTIRYLNAAWKQLFGVDSISPDGSMDRKKIRDLVFNDPVAKQKLEALLHPMIRCAGTAISPQPTMTAPTITRSSKTTGKFVRPP